ncbi:MAG TPA: HU family DNA-binding protein, partial [Jiangellaceae bacterium]|nr:HU family DNA-binding protein [Jiangellaceae bacterium]
MAKKKLVDRIAERFDDNREVAQHALDSVVDAITKSLAAGEQVAIKGFGIFDRQKVKTGSKKGKSRFVPTFSADDALNDVVAGVKKARSRVMESLSLVPSQAAAVAESATRVASSAARVAADVARGESEQAAPAKKTVAKKAAPAKKTVAKKAAPAKKTVAKKAAPAKKTV